MENAQQHIETLAVHAGYTHDLPSGDVTPPIHLSTTFARQPDGTLGDYVYTRTHNPNRQAVEQKLAALEGAALALAFSSGMAAIKAVLETVLAPGDHIVLPDDCYHGTRALVSELLSRWGITWSLADMSDPAQVAAVLRPDTRLVWMETPSNPLLKVTDLTAIVALCRPRQMITVCDSTFATPLLQRPLDLGVDVVIHAATKFFGGHSDLLGGVLMTRQAERFGPGLMAAQRTGGAVLSPFDSWLLYRSLATFPLRFRAQCATAEVVAAYLATHPAIERVYYPGLPDHPGHEIASRQMQGGYGSILSVLVRGGQEAAMQFCGRLRVFRHATSLGGVESLVEHRRSVEGAYPISPDHLIRISIGLEHPEDLLEDLRVALG
ncbi:MAG: PLP-dependent aspartate aminotransferase family protein [Bacteroidia bacterium]|nr:PLP-dependent aspartate aminotransferase family protein [Bacteroidia bacterium]